MVAGHRSRVKCSESRLRLVEKPAPYQLWDGSGMAAWRAKRYFFGAANTALLPQGYLSGPVSLEARL